MITHDKSIFSANDSCRKVWTLDGHGILRPGEKGKGIMVSDFFLPQSQLNLLSLPHEQKEQLARFGVLLEAVTYFEYRKMEEGYWTEKHLLDQIIKKALSIMQNLYPSYELSFMFDNAMSYSIYSKDILQVAYMNRGPGGQQPFH